MQRSTDREQNDNESASSVEAVGATDQDEEHDPMRRILKQCGSYESTQSKLLLVMTHSHSPPVCAESTAALCDLFISAMCKISETQSFYRRGESLEAFIG